MRVARVQHGGLLGLFDYRRWNSTVYSDERKPTTGKLLLNLLKFVYRTFVYE